MRLIKVRGFIVKENYPEALEFTPTQDVEKIGNLCMSL